MKLKTVKVLEGVLIGFAVLCMALLYTFEKNLFGILCLLSLAGAVGVNVVFWRCPRCGRWLGRDGGEFCRHCAAELDESKDD